jgi:hypothetical protein
MKLETSNYQSYLLRMWAVEKQGGVEWRVTIENVATHQTHGFSSMKKLYEFLDRQTENQKDISPPDK